MDKRIFPVALILLTAPLAQAQVFKCVDANGATTYTNDRSAGRGCKQLSEDLPVSSVPAPAKRTNGAAPSQSTPSNFPRVAPEDQRSRDDTRRQVLEKELATEEAALAEAQKALAEQEAQFTLAQRKLPVAQARIQERQDKVDTHMRNIEALKKEIGNLR